MFNFGTSILGGSNKKALRPRRLASRKAPQHLFEPLERRALLASVASVTPTSFGVGLGVNASVTVTFGSAMNASTINNTNFQLLDSSNAVIPGRVVYNSFSNTATFDSASPLLYGQTYMAIVKSAVQDTGGQGLTGGDFSWSFTTMANPTSGPGGPILVVTSTANPFSSYYPEILRAEGLNAFGTADIAGLNTALVNQYKVIVLAEVPLTAAQVTTLTTWVNAGGNLIAMRPSSLLAPLLGITNTGTTMSNTYLQVNTSSGPGAGITGQTMQFHGAADRYTLTGGTGSTALATLFSDSTTTTANSAVTIRTVGSNGGQAAAFSYDLAKSIIYTRQGNPAWAGTERDGQLPIRSNDLFFGAAAGDPQADWVDLNKVQIPQADEQQRLFANMITQMNLDQMPMPRFWYLPNGNKAMVIMTGDDHNFSGTGAGTIGRWDSYITGGNSGGQSVRGTSYIVDAGSITDSQAAQYQALGFDVSAHIEIVDGSHNPRNWTSYADLNNLYLTELSNWEFRYPSIGTPKTNRTHAIVWSDYDSQPQVEFSYNIRLDTTYYYWPSTWVQDRPGMFTGSGMPMRFAKADGTMIDVYQAATQLTDENGATFALHINTLLDNALGSNGYYGVFTVNAHTDFTANSLSDAVVASAKAHNTPIVSAAQMMNWLDQRNASSFSAMVWNNTNRTMSFTVNAATGATGLKGMIPTRANGNVQLTGITRNGSAVSFTTQTIKGIQYAFYDATGGNYVATYATDSSVPTVTAQLPANNATGVSVAFKPSVTFSEDVQAATITMILRDSTNSAVPGTVTYDGGSSTAIFTPTSQLNPNSTYTLSVSGARDVANNQMAGTSTTTFTTLSSGPFSVFPPASVPTNINVADSPIEVGMKFRSDIAGTVTGVRFYKGSGNTGVHIGSLWSSTGTLLAQVTFSGETASGWQQMSFSSPVAISANTTYVISYHSNTGYSVDSNYFATTVDSGYLHGLGTGIDGGNGVFLPGANPAFPTVSFNANNYWVDAVFQAPAGDATPPTITTRTPVSGATNVAASTAISAVFNEGVQQGTISMVLRNAANAIIAGTFAYNSTTLTATFTPSAALAPGAVYTMTVGGAKDASNNTMVETAWSFTTAAVVGPYITSSTPAAGATGVAINATISVVFSEAVTANTIVMSLRDAANTVIAGTVAYNSTTRTATFTPTYSLPGSTNYTMTVSGARNASNQTMASTAISFQTQQVVGASIWPNSSVPGTAQTTTTTASEVGVKFQSNANGTITGIRFYKGTANTGTHVGHLWTSTGTLLGTVTFSGETASGWQTATFNAPIAITAYTTYVASYYAPVGRYAQDNNYFATDRINGSLIAGASSWMGGNGVVRTGTGFPNTSTSSRNYWVDVLFSSNAVADTTAPTITARTPAVNATSVATSSTVTATFSESVQQATISMILRDPGNNSIPGTVTYNAGTNTATFTPTAALLQATTYTMTVSGAQDATGNTMAQAAWSFTTVVPVDNTLPTITAQSPSANATGVVAGATITATFSESVQQATISMVLRDAGNNIIPGTVTYNSGTNTATFTPTNPLTAGTTYTMTVSGAKDVANNTMVQVAWSFSTVTASPNIWPDTSVPATPSVNDPNPIEPGVKFRSSFGGYITGIKFYKGTANTGTHIGHLWSSTGTLLGTATFSGESASGWQTATFTSPVAITANTTYIASYYAPNGGYAADSGYFTSTSTTNGTLTALQEGTDGSNGVFFYGAGGGFPTMSFGSANYWVDVVYSTTPPVDNTNPTITAQTPPPAATGVATGTTVTVTFSESVQQATISMVLRNTTTNAIIAGATTYNAGTNTATFTPTNPLALNTSYTMTVSGAKDTANNTMVQVAWSFTTATSNSTSIWGNSVVPGTPSANDPNPIEPGIKFRSNVAGYITAIRFYKGATNTGTHVAHLWSSTGTLLATETFAGESASGWQEVALTTPVAITANTTYIASYYAPNGGYAADANYFASAVTNGALTALANGTDGGNGVFFYGAGGGFPTMSFNSANYWVDVLFTTTPPADTTAPTITAQTPAPAETGVATGTTVTATFSESVQQATISMVLRNTTTNAIIAGATTYNAGTNTATFTPTNPLALNTSYTMTVSGAQDTSNNPMAQVAWSFVTTPGDVTAPTVLSSSPTSGQTNVAVASVVTIIFSEPMNATTINGTTIELRNTTTNALVAATVTYNAATNTATLTPTSALSANTNYTITVKGGAADPRVKDAAGNALAANFTSAFTTAAAAGGSWQQTTSGDFGTGTVSNVLITTVSGGEMQLGTIFNDDFDGTTLGSGWVTTNWTGTGSSASTVSGGLVTVARREIRSTFTSTTSGIEGRISFGTNAAWQHFGMGTDLTALAGQTFVTFSTVDTSNTLYAVVNNNGALTTVSVGTVPSGLHTYRIDRVANGFSFYIDGVLKTTINQTVAANTQMRAMLSSNDATPSIQADYIRFTQYAATGTYTSAVFDAGASATWGTVNFSSTVPSGATMIVEMSVGNTAVPDGTWSTFTAVTNGGNAGQTGRYVRYRVTFTSTTGAATGILNDIAFAYTV